MGLPGCVSGVMPETARKERERAGASDVRIHVSVRLVQQEALEGPFLAVQDVAVDRARHNAERERGEQHDVPEHPGSGEVVFAPAWHEHSGLGLGADVAQPAERPEYEQGGDSVQEYHHTALVDVGDVTSSSAVQMY